MISCGILDDLYFYAERSRRGLAAVDALFLKWEVNVL
jgi:hypothetical protein